MVEIEIFANNPKLKGHQETGLLHILLPNEPNLNVLPVHVVGVWLLYYDPGIARKKPIVSQTTINKLTLLFHILFNMSLRLVLFFNPVIS